ncbi:MAG: phage major capsid protein [Candidatus Marinimicrobia bacterium]|nr:phage major capsid protein [Candidatus Neomarinimicrobiota bacterium]
MALNYTNLSALINAKYLRWLVDNVFRNRPLTKILIEKAKKYRDRKIVVPLEYASTDLVQFTNRLEELTVEEKEVFTAAEYEPKMLTGLLVIPVEDELVMNSDMAVKNIVRSKVKNLKKSIEKVFSENLWTRGTQVTKNWNFLDTICSSSVNCGGIAVADFAGWAGKAFTITGSSSETNLLDPNHAAYIKKILAKGIARAKYQTGEEPDLIIVPQYIWDLIEFILDPQKTGSALDEEMGKMGFAALKYRNSKIVSDEDMTAKQSGDTDGRIYFLNTEYLYMFFNPGAMFKLGKFIEATNVSGKVAKCHTYGNLCTSNRGSSSHITGVYSPKTYASG